MAFIAHPHNNYKLWDYILGTPRMSIATDRYSHLFELSRHNKVKLSLQDRETKKWTKWVAFPGELMSPKHQGVAIDVHRSMMPNEIVIESDYPDYIDNFEAAKIVGHELEKNGFIPHYYYSGNKSLHIHVYLDWDCMFGVEGMEDCANFKHDFIIWLRTKMINCWDTEAREFDKELIRATHLIRCEGSKNKKGYKTFLGYSHHDLSFIPYICNEDNRIYPRIGKIRLSNPHCINELLEDFLNKEEEVKPVAVSKFDPSDCPNEIRQPVQRLLSDNFKEMKDGRHRAFFIIVSELRRVAGDDKAKELIKDWNVRMGNPMKPNDIEYRFKKKFYTFSNKKIEELMTEIGFK